MIKISIVIPYYNTYKLTERLLKELVIQKTDEIEITLVDDGCHETRLDKFSKDINIIHLDKNMGAPYSWNTGIKASKGDYIAFIDSDDMITMDYVEQLLKCLKTHNEDVITFNWMDLNKNRFVTHNLNVAIWKAIYKRSVVPFFREDVRHQSDVPFQRDLKEKKPTKAHYDRLLYFYNSGRVGSLTWERKNKINI